MNRLAALAAGIAAGIAIRSPAYAAVQMKLGTASGHEGETASLLLTLDSAGDAQGFVAAIDWDPTWLQGADLVPGDAIANADVIVPRIADGFAVLSVIMKMNGGPDKVIPAGSNTILGTFKLKCVTSELGIAIANFADGQYSPVEGGPALDNEVIIGGADITRAQGLVVQNGTVTCLGPPPPAATLKIGDISVTAGEVADVPILLDAAEDVAGVSIVIVWDDPSVQGEDILPGRDDAQADHVYKSSVPNHLMLEVVVFNGIPAGIDREVAKARMRFTKAGQAAIAFARDPVGDPPQTNYVVIDGQAVSPLLVDGTITVAAGGRVPGDCNEDGELDISDAACLLGSLFLGSPDRFPCGDGSPTDAGNAYLLDFQGDGQVDLSDVICLLCFLFLGCDRHVHAAPEDPVHTCVPIAGCDSKCW